jgi:DNA-binding helix-hairpin-helix protein with protein kinase domain
MNDRGPEDQDQPAEPEPEPAHDRPATGDQLATLAAYRAVLTRASFDVQHHSAATGDCPACTAVAAAHFGITIAQQLAGAGFVNGPLIPQLLAMIDDTEAEVRRSQN